MSLVTILGSLHSTTKTRACGAFFLQIIVFLELTRWLMGSTESWSDFDVRCNSHFIPFFLNCLQAIRHSIKLNTVDKLKQILTGFNDECGTHHNRSGKKQDLIDRATSSLDQWLNTKADDKWSKAKTVIAQVRSTGMYVCFSGIHLAIDACVPVEIIYSQWAPENVYWSTLLGILRHLIWWFHHLPLLQTYQCTRYITQITLLNPTTNPRTLAQVFFHAMIHMLLHVDLLLPLQQVHLHQHYKSLQVWLYVP